MKCEIAYACGSPLNEIAYLPVGIKPPDGLIVLTIAARELSEPSCRGSVIAAD
jgi:hypothetical protein